LAEDARRGAKAIVEYIEGVDIATMSVSRVCNGVGR